jgi:hypothetical protein
VDVATYTVAGSAASLVVGAALGWVGGVLLPGPIGRLGLMSSILVGVTALARELGWISFPLLQFPRQTRGIWAKVFPGPVSAALWGFDLGLIFTTWLTFSGVWVLVLIAILVGQPLFGAALFVLYWLGRALSVWLTPLLLPDAGATVQLLDGIDGHRQLFQGIHALGLAWLVVVLFTWLT